MDRTGNEHAIYSDIKYCLSMPRKNGCPSVCYYKHPTNFRGVFWLPSEKIYIYCSVLKYPLLHEYVLKHERKHRSNYNSGKNYVIGIFFDIIHQSTDWSKLVFLKELRIEYRQYEEELSKKNCIITNPDILMKKLCELKPNGKMKMYVKIVNFGTILLPPLVVMIIYALLVR